MASCANIYNSYFDFISDATLFNIYIYISKASLKEWDIPEEKLPRPAVLRATNPQEICAYLEGDSKVLLDYRTRQLGERYVKGPKPLMARTADWVALMTGSVSGVQFYIQSMPNRVCFAYYFDIKEWQYVPGLMLPPLTFLLAESVQERVEGRYLPIFHVIDGMMLGHEDIRKESYARRAHLITLFLESLRRDKRAEPAPWDYQPQTLRPPRLIQLTREEMEFATKDVLEEVTSAPAITNHPGQPSQSAAGARRRQRDAQQGELQGSFVDDGMVSEWAAVGLYFVPVQTQTREGQTIHFSFRACMKERLGWVPRNGPRPGERPIKAEHLMALVSKTKDAPPPATAGGGGGGASEK